MKKFILLLCLVATVSATEILRRDYDGAMVPGSCTNVTYMLSKGMIYMVIATYNGGSAMVNLTKDSLECAKLKKDLK